MTTEATAILAAVLMLGVAFVGAVGAQTDDIEPPSSIDVSLGDVYFEGFDQDDGGWDSHTPPAPPVASWEHGIPTSGPMEASLGDNVWATNLAGEYLGNECGALVSNSIDLSSASSAEVTYDQWVHTYSSEGGALFVSVDDGQTFDYVIPEEGYHGSLSFSVRSCLGLSFGDDGFSNSDEPGEGEYETITVDLEDYLGEDNVRIAFGFAGIFSTNEDGWYIDAFTTTIDGQSTVEDFSDDAGFEAQEWDDAGAPLGWEWGTPTSGPTLDDEDRKMWGTQLDGDYGPNECSWIESPPIDLDTTEASAATKATLQWDQWYRSSSISAAGVVQVGAGGDYHVVEPADGYPSSADSDFYDCLEHEGIGQFDGFEDSSFQGPSTLSADISDFLGEEITIRYIFASADTSFTYDGWFVDNVAVELGIGADVPEFDLQADHPGWNTSGDDAWAWGVATEAGPEGQLAYGTGLNGDYPDGPVCSVLETSLAVPVTGGNLTWDQWLRSSSFSAGGVIQVVDDEGAHNVEPDDGYLTTFTRSALDGCLDHETQDTGAMGGFEQSSGDPMESWSADISDWAGEEVTLRFVWAVDDTTFTYPGWYVNNVALDGLPLMVDSPEALQMLPEDDVDPEETIEDVEAQAQSLQDTAEKNQAQYPGWTVGGEHISWAYDEATTGPEGENVTATNPHGVHSSDDYECSYVQSPPVSMDLAGEDPTLTLDHLVDMSVSSFSGARTAGMILVSDDLGMNWTPLETEANDEEVGYTRIYGCFEELGVEPAPGDSNNRDIVDEVGVISGEMSEMETLEVPLDEFEDAQTLTVRLIFGTGTTIFAQGGWYFNNVSLGDIDLME